MVASTHIKTHTQTQQMAWHISGYTLSRGDKEVWESTSLPPSPSYSKKSVCRFTQTNTPYVSRLVFAVCLLIFFNLFQLIDTKNRYNVHFDPDIFSLIWGQHSDLKGRQSSLYVYVCYMKTLMKMSKWHEREREH